MKKSASASDVAIFGCPICTTMGQELTPKYVCEAHVGVGVGVGGRVVHSCDKRKTSGVKYV